MIPETLDIMTALVLGMLFCLALAIAVVLLVAIPARREGRDVLTSRGEDVVDSMRSVADSARSRIDRSDDADEYPVQDREHAGQRR